MTDHLLLSNCFLISNHPQISDHPLIFDPHLMSEGPLTSDPPSHTIVSLGKPSEKKLQILRTWHKRWVGTGFKTYFF